MEKVKSGGLCHALKLLSSPKSMARDEWAVRTAELRRFIDLCGIWCDFDPKTGIARVDNRIMGWVCVCAIAEDIFGKSIFHVQPESESRRAQEQSAVFVSFASACFLC